MNSDASVLQLILSGDPALFAIVRLSLTVSLSALAVSSLMRIPLGAAIALIRFRGREAVIVLLNALICLPPVVVGLAVYLMLSRSGRSARWEFCSPPPQWSSPRRSSLPRSCGQMMCYEPASIADSSLRSQRLKTLHIAAYSPEARGRSERMFGTLQDRLP